MAYKTRKKQSGVRTQEHPEVVRRRMESYRRFAHYLQHVKEQEALYQRRIQNPLWRAVFAVLKFWYDLKDAVGKAWRHEL